MRLALSLLLVGLASAQSYVLKSITLDGGGGTSTAGRYTCALAVGQPVASSCDQRENLVLNLGFFHQQYEYQVGIGEKPREQDELGGLHLRLCSVSPNPFRDQTFIRYSVATESDVRLELVDVCGRVVQTLVDCRQGAGEYRTPLLWNKPGGRCAAGVYFFRLAGAGEVGLVKVVHAE